MTTTKRTRLFIGKTHVDGRRNIVLDGMKLRNCRLLSIDHRNIGQEVHSCSGESGFVSDDFESKVEFITSEGVRINVLGTKKNLRIQMAK